MREKRVSNRRRGKGRCHFLSLLLISLLPKFLTAKCIGTESLALLFFFQNRIREHMNHINNKDLQIIRERCLKELWEKQKVLQGKVASSS